MDGCVIRWVVMGGINSDKWGIEVGKWQDYHLAAGSDAEISY